jgi:sialate O-acetylesterase
LKTNELIFNHEEVPGMKNRKSFLPFLLLALLILPDKGLTQITFPAIIGDNMVLQQKLNVPFWGWSNPNKLISITPSWNNKKSSCIAGPDGKWYLLIETPSAGGPYSVKINDTVLNNILIGEVWLCSGQSNMQMTVNEAKDAEKEINSADYPLVRLFTVARQFSEEPKKNCYGHWLECSPETVENFSAVAYYYGRELHKELKLPIGLINASWGGTPAEAWTRKEVLQSDTDLKVCLQRYEEKIKKSKPGICPMDQDAPSALYNGMIAPLIPFAIRGVIWYQGEENVDDPELYEILFPVMIQNWRLDWGKGDFPFYYVQIAPFDYEVPLSGAFLRDSQRKTLSLINTGMAVTMDIGNPVDIHPANKQDVGKRLALWALAKDYEKNDLTFSGPLYNSMNIENDKIRLDFQYTSNGLIASNSELRNFEIAGKDEIFVPASAVIQGSSVLVSAPLIRSPLAVRYAFKNTDEASLLNSDGLPASSFRTDTWPLVVESTVIKAYFDKLQSEYLISMNCILHPFEIRYTTDGNEPNRHSELYKEPFHIKKSAMLRGRAFKGETASTLISSLDIKFHLAFGKTPELKYPYNNNYKASGANALTDGLRGSKNFRDGYWQGYHANDLEATMDLGKEKKINKISTGFLQSLNDWIFFPKSVEFFISDNGKDYSSVGLVTSDESFLQLALEKKDYELILKGTKARYIKIKASSVKVCPEGHPGEGEKAWLFADEIVVE